MQQDVRQTNNKQGIEHVTGKQVSNQAGTDVISSQDAYSNVAADDEDVVEPCGR